MKGKRRRLHIVKRVLIMEVIFCLEKGVNAGACGIRLLIVYSSAAKQGGVFFSPPFSVLLHDVRLQDQHIGSPLVIPSMHFFLIICFLLEHRSFASGIDARTNWFAWLRSEKARGRRFRHFVLIHLQMLPLMSSEDLAQQQAVFFFWHTTQSEVRSGHDSPTHSVTTPQLDGSPMSFFVFVSFVSLSRRFPCRCPCCCINHGGKAGCCQRLGR
jgi:hypothetical protein